MKSKGLHNRSIVDLDSSNNIYPAVEMKIKKLIKV